MECDPSLLHSPFLGPFELDADQGHPGTWGWMTRLSGGAPAVASCAFLLSGGRSRNLATNCGSSAPESHGHRPSSSRLEPRSTPRPLLVSAVAASLVEPTTPPRMHDWYDITFVAE